MPAIQFDRFYTYAEIEGLLFAYQSEYPDLVAVESIGKSHEGRDIWLVTLTRKSTGGPLTKPGYWCDANIHASELSTSTAILHILHTLTRVASNEIEPTQPWMANILDTHTFYLVPRLNPDGAEWAMENPPRLIRSSTRPYPYLDPEPEGLERKDIDGDGLILSMRIVDSNGAWKVSEHDPRMLERRQPWETGGTYYRIIAEGELHQYDGMTIRARPTPQGLDLNRNFPSAWRPENEQYGAGDYPTSEPEVRAGVQAIVDRPNICGGVAFHTFSGVHLRPSSRKPDDELPAEDIWAFKSFGTAAKDLTGYPAISNYHEFRYHPKEVITGVFDDWMYEHRGVYAWTTEIWSPQRQAGITDYKYIDWFREHPIEDDLLMLKWNDEKLGGKGYHDWRPFDHPQLGPVEIGGWDASYAFRNPPPDFLEAEVAPFVEWVTWMAAASPRLVERELRVEKVGESVWRVRWAVQNAGWLPTAVTKHAQQKKLCRGVRAQISGGEGNWLLAGKPRQDAGQLTGRSHITAGGFSGGLDATTDVALFDWTIAQPGTYQLEATHERAGTITKTVTIA
ncbi:MAG: M14 family metallopeptidase [Fimbriimonas sp.]